MKGDWHSAKLQWLAFVGHDLSGEHLNLLGDEAEESFNHLSPLMSSVTTSLCEGGSCDQTDRIHRSGTPFLV